MLKTYITVFLLISINPSDSIEDGDQAFEEGDFYSVLVDYTFAIYQGRDEMNPSVKKEVLLKLIFSAYMLDQDEAVLSFSDQIRPLLKKKQDINDPIDSDISALINMISILSESEINPNSALISSIQFQPNTDEQTKFKSLLIANAHLKNRNTDRFEEFYSQFCSLKTCIELNSEEPKQKSQKIARNMSVILPGSGQIYAKNYASGIGAIGITGLGAYLTGKAAVEERYIDGSIIGLLLFYRYYIGNIEEARNSVRAYNASKNQTQYREFTEVLNTEVGLLEETIYHSILHIPF